MRHGPVILMYHGVHPHPDDPYAVTPELLAEHLDFLAAAGWEFLSLETLCQRRRQQGRRALRNAAAITFDDGLRDFFDHAAPMLAQRRISATVFVVTRLMGKTATWAGAKDGPLMDEPQIRELSATGLVNWGSHTASHTDLTILDNPTLEKELRESRAWLVAHGTKFYPFAYPWGRCGNREREAVAATGYDCAVTTEGRYPATHPDDPFQMGRLTIARDTTAHRLQAMLMALSPNRIWRDRLIKYGRRVKTKLNGP